MLAAGLAIGLIAPLFGPAAPVAAVVLGIVAGVAGFRYGAKYLGALLSSVALKRTTIPAQHNQAEVPQVHQPGFFAKANTLDRVARNEFAYFVSDDMKISRIKRVIRRKR